MRPIPSAWLACAMILSACESSSPSAPSTDAATPPSDAAQDAATAVDLPVADAPDAAAPPDVQGPDDVAAPTDAPTGGCSPGGTLLRRTEGTVSAMAVSGDALFYVEFNGATASLQRIPTAGGAPQVVSPSTTIDDMVADDEALYWIERASALAPGVLRRQPRAGGAPVTLAENIRAGGRMALDATHVYYGDIRNMRVTLMRVTRDATGPGTETAVCAHAMVTQGIASLSIANGRAFWRAPDSVLLFSAPVAMPSATCGQVVVGPPGLSAVAADESHAYVGFSGLSMDRIDRIPIGRDTGTRIAMGAPQQIVRDGADLFWALGGTVRRAMPDGSGERVVHAGAEPAGLRVHPSGVYVVTSNGAGSPSTLCRYPR